MDRHRRRREPAPTPPLAYTVRQAAHRLGRLRSDIYNGIRSGEIPTIPHVRPLQISAVVVDRMERGLDPVENRAGGLRDAWIERILYAVKGR